MVGVLSLGECHRRPVWWRVGDLIRPAVWNTASASLFWVEYPLYGGCQIRRLIDAHFENMEEREMPHPIDVHVQRFLDGLPTGVRFLL